jgi:hypothetical protein
LETVGCPQSHLELSQISESAQRPGEGTKMKDMEAHLEKLRRDAAQCAIIRDLATDPKKRDLFTKLAEHMSVLASDVERAIAKDR